MKRFRRLAILCLVFFTGVFAGDYFNLPLWPVDRLKTSFPVEIRVVLESLDQQQAEAVWDNSRYRQLIIRRPNGSQEREVYVDQHGTARTVLQEGVYAFQAIIAYVDDGHWVSYTYPKSSDINPESVRFDAADSMFELRIHRSDDLAVQSKQDILLVYLKEANLAAARALAAELSESTARDIDELIALRETLEQLGVSDYRSMIRALRHAADILSKYGVSPDDQVLRVHGNILHVASRLQAVEQARNMVIQSCLDIMDQFHRSGLLIQVLEEWNQMTGKAELYDATALERTHLATELKRFEQIASEIAGLVPDEIQSSYARCVDLYETGDIGESRQRFTRLLTFIRNLGLTETYAEEASSIRAYIEDIEIIAAANHAMRSDDLNRAMMLFDMVIHPNQLVRDRIEELNEFIRMRGVQGHQQ
ncbi:hypothetical protein JXA80_05100 [bacterium]|nr:hypothetical protein [candidate division CSSED10-310 bacterium]